MVEWDGMASPRPKIRDSRYRDDTRNKGPNDPRPSWDVAQSAARGGHHRKEVTDEEKWILRD